MLIVALVAAVVSFRHMHELALRHGEDGLAAALIPLSVDGTIIAASMSLLLASRNGKTGGRLAWALLAVSSLASLGANVAVAEPSLIGRVIAAWPSFALIGAYEMLMNQVRRAAGQEGVIGRELGALQEPSVDIDPGQSDPRTRRGDGQRSLQRLAWQWAESNRRPDGGLPTGDAIARQFERSHRWGRLVKRAGVGGELS
ncbi:DUF2637 domain-containing protein [Streptosporangium sp. KLBMP 9127]|nr:DUF2637 domain-containing protein [Streptosporangium sp. KLBMP 9127]